MLCPRCSHPLQPRAERCLRCLALVVEERHAPIEWRDPAADADAAPGTSTSNPNWSATSTYRRAADASKRPAVAAQILAWIVDLSIVLACAALHLALATAVIGLPHLSGSGAPSADYWLDLLLRGPRLAALWGAHAVLLAVAYSWLFTALGGRTPGLALAGLRLESVRGGALTIREALARAALSVPSAALGLGGFALALLDPRGQTLHDKLCGAVAVRAADRL
jgi:uncharacterized RDD family membrane protein YckC